MAAWALGGKRARVCTLLLLLLLLCCACDGQRETHVWARLSEGQRARKEGQAAASCRPSRSILAAGRRVSSSCARARATFTPSTQILHIPATARPHSSPSLHRTASGAPSFTRPSRPARARLPLPPNRSSMLRGLAAGGSAAIGPRPMPLARRPPSLVSGGPTRASVVKPTTPHGRALVSAAAAAASSSSPPAAATTTTTTKPRARNTPPAGGSGDGPETSLEKGGPGTLYDEGSVAKVRLIERERGIQRRRRRFRGATPDPTRTRTHPQKTHPSNNNNNHHFRSPSTAFATFASSPTSTTASRRWQTNCCCARAP